jgi:hypothetical protein
MANLHNDLAIMKYIKKHPLEDVFLYTEIKNLFCHSWYYSLHHLGK